MGQVVLDLTDELGPRLRMLDQAVATYLEPQIELATAAATAMLDRRDEPFGWHFLDVRSAPLPDRVRSAALFVLPRGSRPPGHRHPNSAQHMRVLSGTAMVTLSAPEPGPTESLRVTVDDTRRWLVIPENVVHTIEVSPSHELVVLSFHTAREDELLEVTANETRTYTGDDELGPR